MGPIWRIVLVAIALLAASACARPVSAPAPQGIAGERTIVIEMAPAAPEVLAVTRRWRPSDVVHYTVRLTRWNGTAFVDLPAPLEIVLPQKGPIRTHARFTNLAQGQRYRASVTAWGNAGGTAASMPLNTLSPSLAEFDLSAPQDVANAFWRVMRVTLDPAPFNGTAVITPLNRPSGTLSFDLELATQSGEVVFRASYPRQQTMTLSNLKAGLPYTVTLTARRANGLVNAVASAPLSWDANAAELEQDVSVSVSF
jgi:hypothetical protein